MNDLISRKETYNVLIESIDWLMERDYELYCVIGGSIRVCLDEQPTAFDVDKVVEELEKLANECHKAYCVGFNPDDRAEYDAYTNAVEIVKAGGKNDRD